MRKTIGDMIAEVREVNTALGWRTGGNTLGDYAALLHTEVGETTEAYRDHRLADATQRPELTPKARPGSTRCTACRATEVEYLRQQAGPRPPKPEGVGSELADIVIRLFDTCDVLGFRVWDPDMELADVAPLSEHGVLVYSIRTFGDWMAWLHRHIVRFQDARDGAQLLRAVVTVAERFGFDLTFEYQRKIAYNRTRPYQHGGRTLSEATP